MDIKENYNALLKEYNDYMILDQIEDLINWDFETYMPPEGVTQRSKQLEMIATLVHEKITNPRIGELLEKIKNEIESFNEVEKRNISLISRKYNQKVKIPIELAGELAKQKAISTQTWKKAKKEKNYALFKPEFDKVLELSKKKANYIDPNKEPFDVLMDEFEPSMTSTIVTKIFNEMKNGLIPLIKKCTNSPNQPDSTLLKRNCSIDMQRKISEDITRLVNYDLERGRIDETEHPFTTGYYDDVRITTHYYENDFSDSFYSVLHEAGHAIYDQNLSREYKYQPIGWFSSYGIHESQSRFIENVIGRSREFWEFYLPKFKDITQETFSDIDLDSLVHTVNEVKPSKIRIAADEVTYGLHIIIRFEIERDLLAGKITTEELPKVWNAKYKDYLGVIIDNDAEGVMQDTHWASGYFGYFPSYALGNCYGAQMLAKMIEDIPNYKDLIKKGDLTPIINWMTEKVHKPSNLYDPPDLIKRISGEEINVKYFIQYLEEKYSKIYGF